MNDSILESHIDEAFSEFKKAKTLDERRKAWEKGLDLIRQRSQQQIRKMELKIYGTN